MNLDSIIKLFKEGNGTAYSAFVCTVFVCGWQLSSAYIELNQRINLSVNKSDLIELKSSLNSQISTIKTDVAILKSHVMNKSENNLKYIKNVSSQIDHIDLRLQDCNSRVDKIGAALNRAYREYDKCLNNTGGNNNGG